MQGTDSDYGYGIGRHVNNTSVGTKIAYCIGSADGWWPVDTTIGALLGTEDAQIGGGPPKQANYGIRWHDVTFNTAAISLPGFTVDGLGNIASTQTVALSGASGAVVQAGDSVTANSNPLVYSYVVGSSSGALSSLGFNLISGTGSPSRVNTAKNGWRFIHDVRNGTNDGSLVLNVVSSLAASATAVTFDTSGGIAVTSQVQGSFFRQGASGPTWRQGAGTPEGAVVALVGSIFSRTDGGAGTSVYIKESGAGNTGWVAIV